MDNRYAWLLAHNRRKIVPADGLSVIVAIVDEIALFSATIGAKQEQEEFTALLRDLVARGRAAAIPVVAATQRPSFDIIPTSLRDLFGYRAAFRCTTTNSSNIVLGHGWAEQGYTATDISPTNQGAAYLIAEAAHPAGSKSATSPTPRSRR
jgi:DNA segregation ATPase FtsK/SpoIIIE, S-DNA-T family